jgi:hypothetical protein
MNYYLRWGQEASITEQTWQYGYVGRVKPFTIDGYSSVSTVYWFLWPENEKQRLEYKAGTYTLTAYIWSVRRRQPDIASEETLKIPADVARILLERYAKKDPGTRILYLQHRALIATGASESDPEKVWRSNETQP